MDSSPGVREIAVPVGIFAHLQRALTAEAGELAGIRALHAAGYEAGTAAATALRASSAEDPLSLPVDRFWSRVSTFFSRRGWGTLDLAASGGGAGVLSSPDWSESAGTAGEDASCSFSTGFLCGFLSALAGGSVAVLEVRCRGRGDEECAFAFGNAEAVHELYGLLLDGADLDGALSAL